MANPEYSTEHRREFMKTIAKQTLGLSFAGSVTSQGLFGEAQAAESTGQSQTHHLSVHGRSDDSLGYV